MITTLLDWLWFKVNGWLLTRYAQRARRRHARLVRTAFHATITVDDQATPVLAELQRSLEALRAAHVEMVDPRTVLPSQIQTEVRVDVVIEPALTTYGPVVSADEPKTFTVEVGDLAELEQP